MTKDNKGKSIKNLQESWDEFGDEFSMTKTTMIVLEGDEVHGKTFENCIMEKPHNIFFKYKDNVIFGF